MDELLETPGLEAVWPSSKNGPTVGNHGCTLAVGCMSGHRGPILAVFTESGIGVECPAFHSPSALRFRLWCVGVAGETPVSNTNTESFNYHLRL